MSVGLSVCLSVSDKMRLANGRTDSCCYYIMASCDDARLSVLAAWLPPSYTPPNYSQYVIQTPSLRGVDPMTSDNTPII